MHTDQERRRLETIIEAVAIINPKQVEHLKTLQFAFQFKPRKVPPSKLPDDYHEEMSGSHQSAGGEGVEGESVTGSENGFSGLLDESAEDTAEVGGLTLLYTTYTKMARLFSPPLSSLLFPPSSLLHPFPLSSLLYHHVFSTSCLM